MRNSFNTYFNDLKFTFIVHELNPIFVMLAFKKHTVCEGCVFHSLVGCFPAFSPLLCAHFSAGMRIFSWPCVHFSVLTRNFPRPYAHFSVFARKK